MVVTNLRLKLSSLLHKKHPFQVHVRGTVLCTKIVHICTSFETIEKLITVMEINIHTLAVLCSKRPKFRRRFVTTSLAGPPSFRHMLELKISLRIWHYYITQFQLSSKVGTTFVKSTIFCFIKIATFTNVSLELELSWNWVM